MMRRSPCAGPARYVFDAMPDALILEMFDTAAAILAPGGRLCVCCLTYGGTPLSSALTDGWVGMYRISPKSMGGCRPLELDQLLASTRRWHIRHADIVTQMALSSQVVVASLEPPPPRVDHVLEADHKTTALWG